MNGRQLKFSPTKLEKLGKTTLSGRWRPASFSVFLSAPMLKWRLRRRRAERSTKRRASKKIVRSLCHICALSVTWYLCTFRRSSQIQGLEVEPLPTAPTSPCFLVDQRVYTAAHIKFQNFDFSWPATKRSSSRTCVTPTRFQSTRSGVSVIFTVFNGTPKAEANILWAIWVAAEVTSFELVIVNDGSSVDETCRLRAFQKLLIEKLQIELVYLENEQNVGFAASNNLGIRHSRGNFNLLLNTDVQILPGALRAMLNTMQTSPRAAAVGALQLYPKLTVAEFGGLVFSDGSAANIGRGISPASVLSSPIIHSTYISAACVLIRRSALRGVLFDERYGRGYYEDTDMAIGFLRRHLEVLIARGAYVIHEEGASYNSEAKYDLMQENLQKFIAKNKQYLANLCTSEIHQCSTDSYSVQHFAAMYNHCATAHCVLIVDDKIPDMSVDSGSIRLWKIMEVLRSIGAGVHFMVGYESVEDVKRHRKIREILSLGVSIFHGKALQNMRQYKEASYCPWRVIIICRRWNFQQYFDHLKHLCPQARFIFDTVDLHFLREWRSTLKETPSFEQESDYVKKVQTQLEEISMMQQAHRSLVVSSYEKQLLDSLKIPLMDVRVLPNIYDVDDDIDVQEQFVPSNRNGVIFVGSACHLPNQIAFTFLLEELVPAMISTQERFRIIVVASQVAKCWARGWSKLAASEFITAYADASESTLSELHTSALAVVAPLKFGAGVKGKINYGLARGIPVIASEVAVEGMGLVDGSTYLRAETGDEYVQMYNELRNNMTKWNALRQNGIALTKSMYSSEMATDTLQEILHETTNNQKGSRLGCADFERWKLMQEKWSL